MKQSFRCCHDLGLTPHNCMVMGSTASEMAIGGFMPHDLDLYVRDPEKFRELRNRFGEHWAMTNGCCGILVHVDPGGNALPLDITMHWPTRVVSDDDIWRNGEMREGWRYSGQGMCLASLEEFHRPKDLERIPVLKEKLCSGCVNALSDCGIILS